MISLKQRKVRKGMKVVVFCLVFMALGLAHGSGQKTDDAVGRVAGNESVATGDKPEDKTEYAALLAENEALRRENQMLRRELISKNGKLPDAVLPEKGKDSGPVVEAAGEDTGYWISSKTKVRHNKRCRNYRKVKGRPCGPKDGRPCKACGG